MSTAGPADANLGSPASAREDDLAIRVTLPASFAEVAGAILMDLLGSFEQQTGADTDSVTLIFYPPGDRAPSFEEILAALPEGLRTLPDVRIEKRDVSRDWVEGWREHFAPVEIGAVRIRPPWEAPAFSLVDVVINPGLGFGTGLHPTTRGALQLLQLGPYGPLVDVGTGSGILAIAAAKLGWRPVVAFDNDPVALVSTRENVTANGVDDIVQVFETDLGDAPLAWFSGATVVANVTLDPILFLLRRLGKGGARAAGRPRRLVVSGILAGPQESELLQTARAHGFDPARRHYEDEWVSLELLPVEREL